MSKWITIDVVDEGDHSKITLGLEFPVKEWLVRWLFGNRRVDRLVANRCLTGTASETIEKGAVTIILEDGRGETALTRRRCGRM
jgi:hypothetical protein